MSLFPDTSALIENPQILQPIDSETQDRALDATQALIRTLYGDSTGPSPDGLATEICRECIDVLKEPEKTHAQRAVKILSALIKTTGTCYTSVRLHFLWLT